MKYIFILGNNPRLSVAEIKAVLPQGKIIDSGQQFLILDHEKFDCQEILNHLGGTVKIGIVFGKKIDEGAVLGSAMSIEAGKRYNFGFSFYSQKSSGIGMRLKGRLKEKGISARLVTSREAALSSVIVKKEKCHDFLVLPGWFGQTCAVQEFEQYSRLDYGRPASDALSGMLPPKLAKMMINFSEAKSAEILLDPFCGSGTIISQAVEMGFQNLIGSDISDKAVADTKRNIEWLMEKLQKPNPNDQINQNFKIPKAGWINNKLVIGHWSLVILKSDINELSQSIKASSIDTIVTEPYLGPPLRGGENEEQIKKIKSNLEKLYLSAFNQFKIVLKRGGRIVIVFPQWHLRGKIFDLNLEDKITRLGFKRLDQGDLLYKRENQKVWREILIWEKE